jgi:hypothetical protein
MKSRIIAIFLVVFVSAGSTAFGQDTTATGWKISLVFDLTATQTAYSDSWTGGEAGALSWVSNLNGNAEKQLTPSLNFTSRLKLSFGQTHSQQTDSLGDKYWEKPKKSTDLIDWENVGRLTKGWVVDPYAAFRLESQFLDASIEAHKRYFSPLKLTESAGIARKLYERDKDQIISRLGLAIRQTLIKGSIKSVDTVVVGPDTLFNSRYSVEDSSLTDGGIEWVTDAKLTLHENIQYTGKLTVFKALYFSEKDDVKGTPAEDYWKAVDINWENILSAKISKVITVNFYLQFLYDKQVELRGRLKETLGIGFVYNLI